MQDAVGKDVAALQVRGKLDLVDRDEGGVGLARHRLDRAHGVARAGRHDLLLAGDERDLVGPDPVHDAAIDFTREQPQGQADHAAFMRNHAVDGEMGLASVRGTENGSDVPAGKHKGRICSGEDIHRGRSGLLAHHRRTLQLSCRPGGAEETGASNQR